MPIGQGFIDGHYGPKAGFEVWGGVSLFLWDQSPILILFSYFLDRFLSPESKF